jgi:hypothetical protein
MTINNVALFCKLLTGNLSAAVFKPLLNSCLLQIQLLSGKEKYPALYVKSPSISDDDGHPIAQGVVRGSYSKALG